jgi:hypothetical protein
MKNPIAVSAAVSLAALLAGCTTPYAPSGPTGGFSESRIDDTTYRVRFSGNGNTTRDMVWNYWIYRCAELTKAKGYVHFALSFDQTPKPVSQLDESPRQVADRDDAGDGGYLKTKGGGGGYYYYSPGYSYTVTTYSANGIIHMYGNTVPMDVPYYLRAQTVLDSLKGYVLSGGRESAPSRDELLKRAGVDASATVRTSPINHIRYGDGGLDDFKDLLPAK